MIHGVHHHYCARLVYSNRLIADLLASLLYGLIPFAEGLHSRIRAAQVHSMAHGFRQALLERGSTLWRFSQLPWNVKIDVSCGLVPFID